MSGVASLQRELEERLLGSLLTGTWPDLLARCEAGVVTDPLYAQLLEHLRGWGALSPSALVGRLEGVGLLGALGGAEGVGELIGRAVPDADAVYEQLAERAWRRQVAQASLLLARAADAQPPDAVHRAFHELGGVVSRPLAQVDTSLRGRIASLFERIADKRFPPAIPLPFPEVERHLVLAGGDYVVLGARPRVGKTQLLIQCAMAAAAKGVRVAFYSLEMPSEQIVARMMAQVSGFRVHALRSGDIPDGEYAKLVDSHDRLAHLPVDLIDARDVGRRWSRIAADVRARVYAGAQLVVLDYIGLAEGDARAERRQELGAISRSAQGLAKDHEVAVLVGAQLSRKVEAREDQKPILEDLKESGSLEEDADTVLLLWRQPLSPTQLGNYGELLVAKHRHGPTLTVGLRFDPRRGLFGASGVEVG